MGRIYVDFDHDVPRFAYTECNRCNSVMGTSLCSVKNRGCCSYFPKFSLTEIHRMSKSVMGLQTLEQIVKHPGSIVKNYVIQSTGVFDKVAYDEYIKSGNIFKTLYIKDQTLFFKTCPFVKSGYGCTIPSCFRTVVCNFFLCNELLERPSFKELFETYLENRLRYARWLHRENLGLEYILKENGLNLVRSFDKTIRFLQELPIYNYDFPVLDPIEI